MVRGLNFLRPPSSSLEGDEFQSTDTYNNSICTYNNLEDEEVMKMSKRTRTSLKMHKLLRNKGKVDYNHMRMNVMEMMNFPWS